MSAPKKPRPMTQGKALEALALALGKSVSQIKRHARKPDAPPLQRDGKPNIAAWAESLEANPQTKEGKQARLKLTDERTKAQTEMILFRLEVERGKYVELSKVMECNAAVDAEIIAALRMELENQVPPLLEGLKAAEIQTVIRSHLNKVFKVLHEKREEK